MAFDYQGFREEATQSGLSDEDIKLFLNEKAKTDKDVNFALEKERASSSAMGRFLTSGIIPGAFAIAGTGVGALGMNPLTAGLGGFAGYGAGKAVEDTLLRATGIRQTTPKVQAQHLLDVGKGAVASGATNAALVGGTKALGKLIHPLRSLGQARTSAIGQRAVQTSTMEEEAIKRLTESKYYKYASPKAQKEAMKGLTTYLRELAPLETVGEGGAMTIQQPTEIGLNKAYQELIPFETAGGAYGPTSAQAQGTQLASRAVRSYLGEEIPRSAQIINRAYGAGKGVEPYLRAGAYSVARQAPWILGGGYLMNKLQGLIGTK